MALPAEQRADHEGLPGGQGRSQGKGLTEQISQEVTTDEETGKQRIALGTRGTFQPLTLLSNIPFGAGLAGAVAAGKAIGPATGFPVGLDALGQRRTITSAGSYAPTIDLGFRPADSISRAASRRRAAGQQATAVDQLAFDYAETRQASIDAAQLQRANRADRVPDLVRSLPQTSRASRPAATTSPGPSAFGRLSGRDPTAGVDLLRTGEGAAVAAGLAPARPRLTGNRGLRPTSVI